MWSTLSTLLFWCCFCLQPFVETCFHAPGKSRDLEKWPIVVDAWCAELSLANDCIFCHKFPVHCQTQVASHLKLGCSSAAQTRIFLLLLRMVSVLAFENWASKEKMMQHILDIVKKCMCQVILLSPSMINKDNLRSVTSSGCCCHHQILPQRTCLTTIKPPFLAFCANDCDMHMCLLEDACICNNRIFEEPISRSTTTSGKQQHRHNFWQTDLLLQQNGSLQQHHVMPMHWVRFWTWACAETAPGVSSVCCHFLKKWAACRNCEPFRYVHEPF